MAEETIFTWGAPPLKFGPGAADEVGFEMQGYGVRRALIVTDPGVSAIGAPQRIADALRRYDIESEIFDGVHVEPTDDSMNKAVEYARAQGEWDGFVAVGGGSAIDTAKAINLLTSHPGELMDYINKPIGRGQDPPGALKPLIAIPTTAGTGSESNGDVHPRRPLDEGEDGDQPLAPAAHARRDRPAVTMSLPRRGLPRRRGWTSSATPSRATPRSTTRSSTPRTPEERVTLLRLETRSPTCGGEKAMGLHRDVFRASGGRGLRSNTGPTC